MQSPTRPQDYFVRHEPGGDRISIEEARAQPRVPIITILDHIRSAHNVGSIFRTSDGANIAELYLCGYTPTPPHRHLSKTALGAVDTVPWQHFATVPDAIEAARAAGAQLVAMEFTDDSELIYDFEPRFPMALILGNETNGLSAEIRAACDATVHLPMYGHKSSLNVSVAYGVAVYEFVRRYHAQAADSQ
jgi:tRNA G18 (ribose-2'-O)-methylase SpoU